MREAKKVARSSKFSARKVRVSTWLPAECDGMNVRRKWQERSRALAKCALQGRRVVRKVKICSRFSDKERTRF